MTQNITVRVALKQYINGQEELDLKIVTENHDTTNDTPPQKKYMVCVEHKKAPKIIHNTLLSAQIEADRLAKKHENINKKIYQQVSINIIYNLIYPSLTSIHNQYYNHFFYAIFLQIVVSFQKKCTIKKGALLLEKTIKTLFKKDILVVL